MAKDPGGGTPRGRFSKSGHTSHGRASGHPPAPPSHSRQHLAAASRRADRPPPPRDRHRSADRRRTTRTGCRPGRVHDAPRTTGTRVDRRRHSGRGPRWAAPRCAYDKAARVVTRKVINASKSDGAHESGLTALIWNQVLSYGTDAMITVALAGTVFFGASTHAQRGNVLLYLLITMAPFAIVAPIIGPALDRLQHGRRWTMAGTAIGRAVLALIMAGHPTELLVLYPCALGSLVFSKAYAVVRAAAAPRLVPPGMTLTEANARLSIFGLGSTLVLGGLVGVVIKMTGSYSLGLWLTAIGFAVCAYFAFRLPPQVDSAVGASRHPQEPPRPRTQQRVPPLSRIAVVGAPRLRPARGDRAAGRVGTAAAVGPADDLPRVLRREHSARARGRARSRCGDRCRRFRQLQRDGDRYQGQDGQARGGDRHVGGDHSRSVRDRRDQLRHRSSPSSACTSAPSRTR